LITCRCRGRCRGPGTYRCARFLPRPPEISSSNEPPPTSPSPNVSSRDVGVSESTTIAHAQSWSNKSWHSKSWYSKSGYPESWHAWYANQSGSFLQCLLLREFLVPPFLLVLLCGGELTIGVSPPSLSYSFRNPTIRQLSHLRWAMAKVRCLTPTLHLPTVKAVLVATAACQSCNPKFKSISEKQTPLPRPLFFCL
jgi:hypothetical protein